MDRENQHPTLEEARELLRQLRAIAAALRADEEGPEEALQLLDQVNNDGENEESTWCSGGSPAHSR